MVSSIDFGAWAVLLFSRIDLFFFAVCCQVFLFILCRASFGFNDIASLVIVIMTKCAKRIHTRLSRQFIATFENLNGSSVGRSVVVVVFVVTYQMHSHQYHN